MRGNYEIAAEIGSRAMIHKPSFRKTGSDIKKLTGRDS
jgi:hypothetical protein